MVNFMDFYYTGPSTLAAHYMRKFWHPVYRAEDLKPGWAKPIKIMSESSTCKNTSPPPRWPTNPAASDFRHTGGASRPRSTPVRSLTDAE